MIRFGLLLILVVAWSVPAAFAQMDCSQEAEKAKQQWQWLASIMPEKDGRGSIGWRKLFPSRSGCFERGDCQKATGKIESLGQRTWIGSIVGGGEDEEIWLSVNRVSGRNPAWLTACLVFDDDLKPRTQQVVSTIMESNREMVLQSFTSPRPALLVLRLKGQNALREMGYEFWLDGGAGPVNTLDQAKRRIAKRELDDLRTCSAQESEAWRFVSGSMLGVSGWNPDGERIGTASARKKIPKVNVLPSPNWHPVDGFRHPLCGRVADYVEFSSGKERDLNHFLIPGNKFRYLLETPKELLRLGWLGGMVFDAAAEAKAAVFGADHPQMMRGIPEWWDCAGPDDCIETEITPHAEFHDNPYFNANGSALEGRETCVYGPWVTEESHNNRPEIHPAELIWWRARGTGLRDYHLVILQDGSERFGSVNNYRPESELVRPWIKAPLRGEFWVAFQVSPQAPLTYVVESEDSKHTGDNLEPGAIDYTLNGQPILGVRDEAKDTRLAIDVVNACKVGGTDQVRGYLAVTGAVGIGTDDSDVGFWILRVRPSQGIAPSPETLSTAHALTAARAPQLRASFSVVPNSLRRIGDNLILEIRVASGEDDPDGENMILPILGPRPSDLSDAAQAALGRPLGLAPTLAPADSGRTPAGVDPIRRKIPDSIRRRLPTTPIKRGGSATVPADPRSAATWARLSKALGIESLGPSVRLQRVGQTNSLMAPLRLQVDLGLEYAILRGGSPAVEDGSEVAAALNEAIESLGPLQLQELYGSSTPFASQWAFSARNVASGEQVYVSTTGFGTSLAPRPQIPSGTDLRKRLPTQGSIDKEAVKRGLEKRSSALGARGETDLAALARPNPDNPSLVDSVEIQFADDDEVYEVTASAVVTDSYGNRTRVRRTFWSHELRGPTSDLRQLARRIAGVTRPRPPADEKATPRKSHLRRLGTPLQEIKAQAFLTAIDRSVLDGRLDMSELEALSRLRQTASLSN